MKIDNTKLGKWKKIKTGKTYRCGKHYFIDKDEIKTPGNKKGAYFVIRRSHSGVIIVPVDKGGNFYLTRQHRYPVNDFSVEFPAGSCDKGEDILSAAKRELKEEMHLASKSWKKLGRIYLAKGIMDCEMTAYLARDVFAVQGESDDPIDQNLHQTEKISLAEIEKKIKNGEINASPTITSLTLYKLNFSNLSKEK